MEVSTRAIDQRQNATDFRPGNAVNELKVDMADPRTREVAQLDRQADGVSRRSHDEARKQWMQLAQPITRSAESLQNGLPEKASDLKLLKDDLSFFSGTNEFKQFVNRVNEQLSQNGSDTRLVIGPADPKDPNKIEVNILENGQKSPLFKIDSKEPKEKFRAENVSDALRGGADLGKQSSTIIENAFKQAYAEGGQAAVDSLFKRVNAQLKEDKSELRLVKGDTNIKSITAQAFDVFNPGDSSIRKGVDFDAADPVEKIPEDGSRGRRTSKAPASGFLTISPIYA